MRRIALCLVLAALPSLCLAQASKPRAGRPAREKKDDKPRLDIDLLQRIASTEEERRKTIEALRKKRAPKAKIAEAEAAVLWEQIDFPLKVGNLGTPQGLIEPVQLISVAQVIDDDTFVATIYRRRTGTGSAAIDRQQRRTASDNQTAWFKGFPTKGFADGDRFELKSDWRVTGTKRYETADGGTKQVVVFEPFDVAPYFAELKRKAAAGDEPADPARDP
jgi:hypothetical protein